MTRLKVEQEAQEKSQREAILINAGGVATAGVVATASTTFKNCNRSKLLCRNYIDFGIPGQF